MAYTKTATFVAECEEIIKMVPNETIREALRRLIAKINTELTAIDGEI